MYDKLFEKLMEAGLTPQWTQSVAEEYLVEIAPILQKAGYVGTIIGSVAIEGFSEHDLDIWLAPTGDKGDFKVVEDAIPMEGSDYIGEDVPHYAILSDGKSVDFHLAEEEGELEESQKWMGYKFWLLSNGRLLPVKNTHEEAAAAEGSTWRSLLRTGAIRGSIGTSITNKGEMNLQSEKQPSTQQRAVLRQLYIEYKVDSVWMDAAEHVGGKLTSWHIKPKSVKELDYYLTYGKDVDEAKSEEDDKEQFFIDRTQKHIQLVQGAAAKIVDAYPEFDSLLKQVEVHDQSKLEEPERTPYVEITWRHKQEREVGGYDPYNGKGYQKPGELEKEDENAATMHHITTNSHHPEYHLENKAEANINKDDRNKSDKVVDASLMPEIDIAEMVADWQAMSEELQTNTTRQWFEKQKDVRWHFSEQQEELIGKLLRVFEDGE